MPGRFIHHSALVSNGASAQKYVYEAIQLDQDYDVISAGAAPDSGSVAGQLSAWIGVHRGPMPSAVTQQIAGPNKTDFAGAFALETTFGPVVERLLGDYTDQANHFVSLWATVNPKFYNRMPRIRAGDWVVFLMFDTKNGDSVTRAVQVELVALPTAQDNYPTRAEYPGGTAESD